MAVCLDVDSDATRRDDRQDDSTDGTDKVACSQSQHPVILNRDTIVPDFVILANPLKFMCSDTLVNQQTGWEQQQRASSSVAASMAVSML